MVLGALVPSRAGAQEPPGIVSHATRFDPSIQSAGMGSASVAAFWMDDLNEWRNPAALGSVQGIRYSHGRTEGQPILPEFDELRSDRLLAGAFGIGVSVAGKPLESIGGHRLNYDPQTVTDPFGTPVTFFPYEEVRSFSVGVSVLDLLSSTAQALGSGPIGFRDRISISLGHTWNDLFADMGVDSTFQPRTGEGESRDRGALARIALLDEIGSTVREPRDEMAGRIELGGGYVERNYRDPAADAVVRVLEREEILGASARGTVAFPTPIGRGWFWDFATPTLEVAFAWERTEGDVPTSGGTLYDLIRFGGEVTILDMFSVRHGRVDDASGLEGETWGAGVSLQYRKAVGVRFDWARVPWAEDSEELDRYSISVFLDPLKFDASGGLAPRE